MGIQQGSTWSKWDLHVHTPSSMVQHYGADNDATWEAFIQDLEGLSPEFKVIGVNDYLFIDGYRRLRAAKESGRLKNIELLLPVIELRIAMFGGSKSQLSRVNFHVIFSDELDPEIIQQHFINALPQHFQLSPEYDGITWKSLATRESLADLGQKIIASVPADKQAAFGSPLLEGFNNLNFDLAKVREVLESQYLADFHLTAVGKTEWADIKWSDNTIASKKSVINKVDFVFTAAVSPTTYDAARTALKNDKVCDRLLDCSDAHRHSSSSEKDRIGNCFSWIKAEPTFLGLKHVVREFDARVFVGDLPEKLRRTRDFPKEFIQSIAIDRIGDADSAVELWFDTRLDLSSDLVAIIGNKGSGKSALADVIGLLGETPNHAHFSFLNKHRFRQNRGEKACCFEAKLTLHTNEVFAKRLDIDPDGSRPAIVKYIPQQYLEFVCNEVAQPNETEFDREVKQVIFSHVPENEQLGFETLDEVLAARTAEIEREAAQLRARLQGINTEIIRTEEQLEPEHRRALAQKLAAKQLELSQHAKLKPSEISKPPDSSPAEQSAREAIAELQKKAAVVEANARSKKKELDDLTRRALSLAKLIQRVSALQNFFELEKDEMRADFEAFGLKVDEIAKAHFELQNSNDALSGLNKEKATVTDLLDPAKPESLTVQLRTIVTEITKRQALLAEPQRKYQEYLTKLNQWTTREVQLRGSESEPNSLLWIQSQIVALDKLPQQLVDLRGKRIALAKDLYSKLEQTTTACKSLYQHAQNFINTHPVVGGHALLTFSASIEDVGFAEDFLGRLDQRTKGRFAGLVEGERTLAQMLKDADFNTWDGTRGFLEDVSDALNADNKHAQRQLRKQESLAEFYNFIFSFQYLRPHYSMELAGKQLRALSPGERGTLLLIFYLIIDKSLAPIVIDQPEDNLDNHTIYTLLVPCIRDAKKRRQIVLVTHSPNLAVVCDAEQIVYASYQADGVRLRYEAGALENPKINERVLSVLEGTRPAFEDRRRKYQPFQD